MTADWNRLFRDPGNVIRDPDPLIDQFISTIQPQSTVLDLGCGAGRHLIHLAKRGFEVFGGDPSPTGLELSRQWLAREKLRAGLLLLEMTYLPFDSETVDGVISVHVLNHAVVDDTARAVREVHRILRTGKPFFFVILGREDARYGEGDQIEPNTFVHHQGIEAGVPHHFYDRAEVDHLLREFDQIEIEERRRHYDDNDPVFGRDPRLQGRDDLILQHWAVRAWK